MRTARMRTASMPGREQPGTLSRAVDLNADLGELPGVPGAAIDDALLGIVTSANVATGGHAGDLNSMKRVCQLAATRAVSIGAHLSFEDRPGFGRRVPERIDAGLVRSLREQLQALAEAAETAGTRIAYVKAHGALYNLSLDRPDVAEAILDAVHGSGLGILTIQGSVLQSMAAAAGVRTYAEFFADRGYLADGRLVPRGLDGDLVLQDVEGRALRAVLTGSVASSTGQDIEVQVDSICLHGDTPGAVELARRVRDRLLEARVEIRPFCDGRLSDAPTP